MTLTIPHKGAIYLSFMAVVHVITNFEASRSNINYLVVHIKSAKAFACSLANAEKSFYRAFNAVFGKVAGVASEEVTVELLKVKCLPVLLYGFEACPISNKQFNSLDFVLKGCFRKIFRTKSAEVVQNCMLIFNCMSIAGMCCQP